MKLFLASSADQTLSQLEVVCPGIGKKVLFVANAADLYHDHFWVDWDRDAFKKLGYVVTDVDLRKATPEEFELLLAGADILHTCGGSVSYLNWILKEKKFAPLVAEAVRAGSIVYTGTSAGSMIVSENLAMFAYDEEEKEYAEKGFCKNGLGLVPWTIVPHSNSNDFLESHKKVVDELLTNPTAVIFLHDNQAVWVENDTFKIIQT